MRFCFALLVSFFVACSSSSSASSSDASTDSGGCAIVSGSCPASCSTVIEGRRYDSANACLAKAELVGCAPGVDAPTISRCRKQVATGALYRFDLMEPALEDPAWASCTDAEAAPVLGYPPPKTC